MRAFGLIAPVLFAVAFPATIGMAQEGTKPPAKVETPAQPVKETWVIAKVGDQMKVMKASEVADAKKKLEADHKAAMAKHQEAMKAAEAKHAKFDQPAPTAQMMTLVASDLKSADEAGAQMKKLMAEHDEKAKEHGDKAKEHGDKAKEHGEKIKEKAKEVEGKKKGG